MRRLALATLLVAAACTSEVAPKNPYDPATPPELQAKAALRGTLVTSLLASKANLQVGLRHDGKPMTPVATNLDGLFVFDSLVPGSYQLEIGPTGFVPLSLSVKLAPGQDLDVGPVDLVPLSGASASVISGRVTLEGAADLSGSLVEAVGAAFTAVSDSAGNFRLDIIPGTYSLQFSHPAFKTYRLESVTVTTGEAKALPDDVLLYVNPAHVTGTVQGEVIGGVPAPLQGAQVTVDGHTGLAQTGPSGDFQLDVPAGSYVLRVSKPGYADFTVPMLNLTGGDTFPVPQDPVVLARARGGITGRVALAEGGDPSGAVVEVTGAGRATVAAADGGFRIDGLVVGVYEVSARKDGYGRAVQGSLTVTEGGLADAGTLTLARQGGTVSIVEAPYTSEPTRLVHVQLNASGVTHYHASEDPAFGDPARGDTLASPWRAFIAGQIDPFTIGDADGEHRIYVSFSNGGVSPGAAVSATVVLDRTAPVNPTLVVGDGSGWSRSTDGLVSLTLSAQDLPASAGSAVSGLGKVQLVAGTDFAGPGVVTLDFNGSTTWALGAPAGDGLHTVSVRYLDRAGNVSATATRDVVVDTKAPANATLALAGPDLGHPGTTSSPIVTATLSATDDNAGTGGALLLVRLSNTPGFVGARYQPFSPGLTWILTPGDGTKTVYAQFMDAAGNESGAISATIELKTSGPTAPGLLIDEKDARPANGYTSSRSVGLQLQALGAPVLALVADNPALNNATTFSLAGQPVPFRPDLDLPDQDGTHTLWVRYFDAAGNGSDLAAAAVVLDRAAPLAVAPAVAPVVAVSGGATAFTASTAVTLTAPAAGQDDLSVDASAGNVAVAWTPAATGAVVPVTLSGADGAKTLVVRYRDLADNLSAPVAVTVLLDTALPTAGAVTVTGALADGSASTTVTTTPSVVLALSPADAGSGVAEMLLSESPTLAGAAWQPYQASAAFVLSPGDGPKTVYAKFRDAVGHVSAAAAQGGISLDTTGPSLPTVSITESDPRPANGWTNSRSVALTLGATGAVRALVAESPSFAGATAVTGPFPRALPASGAGSIPLADADGLHTIWVRFFDAAGNASDLATAQVNLDRTPPAPIAPAVAPSPFAGSTSVALTAPAAGQDELQVAASSDNVAVAWTAAAAGAQVPVTLSGADGQKGLAVSYRDLADNVTGPIAVAVGLDQTNPTAAPFAVTGALADGTASTALTATRTVTVDLSAAADGAGSGVKEMMLSESNLFPGAAWQPFAAAAPFTLSAGDGPKTVFAKVRDGVARTSATVSGTITLDTTGPTAPSIAIIEGDASQNGVTAVAAIRLTLGAAGSPVKALVADNPALSGAVPISLAANPYTTPGTALTLSGPDGAKAVYARFADAAGNLSDLASATVTLDTTPPLATPPAVAPSPFTASTTITLTPPAAGQEEGSISGAGAVAKAFVAAPAGGSYAVTLTAGDGLKSFSVTWRDAAGNVSAAIPLSVTLDQTPPTAAAFTVRGALADGTASTALTTTPAVTLDLSGVSDGAGSGVKEMLLSENALLTGATWIPFNAAAAFTLSAGDAPKTVYARFRDALGNTTASAVQGTITLDTTRPSGAGLSITEADSRPSNGFTNSRNVALTLSATGATRALVAENAAFTGATAVTGPFPKTTPATGAGAIPLSDADGLHTIWVRYFDDAGNASDAVSASVALDRVGPSATAPTATAAFVGTAAVTLTAPSAGQDDVQVNVTSGSPGLAWTPFPAGSSVSIPLSTGDGLKSLSVTYRDAADNTVTVTGSWVTLDGTPPTAAAFTVRGTLADGSASTAFTTTTAVILDLSGVSDGTGSGVKEMLLSENALLTGATWIPFNAAAAFTLSSGDAPKVVYARFRDALGNATAAAVQGGITLDTAGPAAASVTIAESDTRPANGFTNSRNVALTLTASGATRALVAESPAFTGATAVAGPFPKTTPASGAGSIPLADADGLHTVWVRFFDAAGNASDPATAAVTLTRTGPAAIAPTLSVGSATTSTTVAVIAPAAGQEQLMVAASAGNTSGAAWATASAGTAVPVTLLGGDGLKTLQVSYRDLADNVTGPIAVTVTLDATAPAASAFTVTGQTADGLASSSITATTGVTLDLSGQADATTVIQDVLLSNDALFAGAAWQTFVQSTKVPWVLSPGDGTKIVYARFRDRVGNVSGTVQGQIQLLASPPTGGTLTIEGGAAATNRSVKSGQTVHLALGAVGAAQMRLTIDSIPGAWETYATGKDVLLTSPPDGTKVISVLYRNAANVEGAGATAAILLDTAAPTLASLSLTGTLADSQTSTAFAAGPVVVATVGYDTADAGLTQMAFSEGAGCDTAFGAPRWQPFAPTATYVLTSGDGVKTLCAKLADEAGNVSAIQLGSLKLDTVAPPNPTFTNLTSRVTNARTIPATVAALAADPLPNTAYEFQCLGGQYGTSWTTCVPGGGLAFSLLQNQDNQLGIRTRDQAHNASTGTIVTVTHDSIAPQPPVITSVATTSDTLTLRWIRSPDADVADYLVTYGNTAGDAGGTGAAQGSSPVSVGSASATSLALTGLTAGTPYYVSVVAVDRAGNASVPSAQRVAVPNVANPRLLASIGGKPRAVGVAASGAVTYAYLAENLGVIQLDVSDDLVTPPVTGRVPLDNFVPDGRPIAVVACTRQRVAGHCMVLSGTTLEGDYDGQPSQFRNASPVVFFPATGGPGVVAALLPSAGHAAAIALVDGVPVAAVADSTAMRFYGLSNPDSPTLLASSAFTGTIASASSIDFTGTRVLLLADGNAWAWDVPALVSAGVVVEYGNRGPASGFLYASTVLTDAIHQDCDPFDPEVCTPVYERLDAWDPVSNAASSNFLNVTGQPATAYLTGPAGAWSVHSLSSKHIQIASPGVLGAVTWASQGLGGGVTGGTVAAVGGVEHAFWLVSNGDERLARTTGTANGAMSVKVPYIELPSDVFAVVDATAYIANGPNIQTIDASNPLAPFDLGATASSTGGTYQSVAATGGVIAASWIKAGGTYGVDLYWPRRRQAPLRIGTATNTTWNPYLAVSGNYLFGGVDTLTQRLDVWSWTPAGAIAKVGTYTNFGAAVAARRDYRAGAPVYAVYSVSDLVTPKPTFYAHAFDPVAKTVTQLAAVTLPGPVYFDGRPSITLSGRWAYVSDAIATWRVDLANPFAPVVSSQVNSSVAGRVVPAGGYLAGLAPASQPHGPALATEIGGTVDGALPYARCSATGGFGGQASYALIGAIQYASCHQNGLVISSLANPASGQLFKSYGGAMVPGAGDGVTSYLADNVGNVLQVDESPNAAALPTSPTLAASAGGKAALAVFDGWAYSLTSAGTLKTWQVAGDGTWNATPGTTVALTASVLQPPVHDARRLYVASGGVATVDVTAPAAPVVATSATTGVTGNVAWMDFAGTSLILTDGNNAKEYETTTSPFTLRMSAVANGFGSVQAVAVQGPNFYWTDGFRQLGVTSIYGVHSVFYTSRVRLSNPVVVGDLLYVMENSTLLCFDLRPFLRDNFNGTPVRLTPVSPDATPVFQNQLWVSGPFAYGLVSNMASNGSTPSGTGSYRAWDLR